MFYPSAIAKMVPAIFVAIVAVILVILVLVVMKKYKGNLALSVFNCVISYTNGCCNISSIPAHVTRTYSINFRTILTYHKSRKI